MAGQLICSVIRAQIAVKVRSSLTAIKRLSPHIHFAPARGSGENLKKRKIFQSFEEYSLIGSRLVDLVDVLISERAWFCQPNPHAHPCARRHYLCAAFFLLQVSYTLTGHHFHSAVRRIPRKPNAFCNAIDSGTVLADSILQKILLCIYLRAPFRATPFTSLRLI